MSEFLRSKIFKYVLFEVAILIFFFLLAMIVSSDLMIAVAATCVFATGLGTASADWLTGIECLRLDNDRLHGASLLFLFLGMGFTRATIGSAGMLFVLAIGLRLFSIFIFEIDVASAVFYSAIEVACFGVPVFALAYCGWTIAIFGKLKPDFHQALTALRVVKENEDVEFGPTTGILMLAVSSSASLLLVFVGIGVWNDLFRNPFMLWASIIATCIWFAAFMLNMYEPEDAGDGVP